MYVCNGKLSQIKRVMGIGVKNCPSFFVIFCTRSLTFYDNQDITLFISHNYVCLTTFCISSKLPFWLQLYMLRSVAFTQESAHTFEDHKIFIMREITRSFVIDN